MEANQPVELRAIGQGREGSSQIAAGVAVEVAFAGESGPTGEDGKGKHLALGEGRLRAGPPFWRPGLAEVVHRDVECVVRKVSLSRGWVGSFPFGIGIRQADSNPWAPSAQIFDG